MPQVGIIWGENALLSDAGFNTNAPFQIGLTTSSITGVSGRGYQFCNNISGVDHPSTPNYNGVTGGSNAISPGVDGNEFGVPAGPSTTVNGGQTAPSSGTWTLTVASTTGFDAGPATIWADHRLLAYSSNTATTFTITNGGYGHTYANGASVSQPNNIFDQCEAAGITWKTYEEGKDGVSGSGPYADRHCPAGFYANPKAKTVGQSGAAGTMNVRADIPGTAGLTADIVNGHLPKFFMVSPSDTNSGHNPGLAWYDGWLQGHTGIFNGPPIVNTNYPGHFTGIANLLNAMDSDGVLLLGCDGHNGSAIGPYFCLVMTTTPPASTPSVFTTAGTHYNVLYAIQLYLFGNTVDPRFSTTRPAQKSSTTTSWSAKVGNALINDNYRSIGQAAAIPFPSASISPTRAVAPSSLTFPNTNPGAISSPQTVTITNTGGGTLTGTASLGGTNPSKFNITNASASYSLAANANKAFTLTFNPSATDSPGTTFTANLVFTDNASGSPFSVPLSGTVTPPVGNAVISPLSLTFNVAAGGTSNPQTITVSNTGGSTLTVNSLVYSGSGASQFSTQTDGLTGQTITAGANKTCTVVFSPPAGSTTTANAILTISDSSGTAQTQPITLTGSPLAGAPVGTLSPVSQDFGTLSTGTTGSPFSFTLTNTGANPSTLNITAVSVVGTNASEFTIFSDSGQTSLAFNASRTVAITFKPSTAGTKSATLQFTDNSGGVANTNQTVALTGTATSGVGQAQISPASPIQFADTVIGQVSQQVITVTNTGTGPLSISTISISPSTTG